MESGMTDFAAGRSCFFFDSEYDFNQNAILHASRPLFRSFCSRLGARSVILLAATLSCFCFHVEGFSILVHRHRCNNNPNNRLVFGNFYDTICGINGNNNHQQYCHRINFRQSCSRSSSDSIAMEGGSIANGTINSKNKKIDETADLLCNHSKSHSLTVCLVPPTQLLSPLSQNGGTPDTIENHYMNDVRSCPNKNITKQHDENSLWKILTALRVELRDPGLYRWPPHVNLLYPFVRYEQQSVPRHRNSVSTAAGPGDSGVVIDAMAEDSLTPMPTPNLLAILAKLRRAASRVKPFWVALNLSNNTSTHTNGDSDFANNKGNRNSTRSGFGTFGGPNRGVLWLYPTSFRIENKHSSSNKTMVITSNNAITNPSTVGETTEPIAELQSLLEDEFPMCSESLKRRNFLPHMTLSSKFDSLDDARTAETTLRNLPLLDKKPLNLYFWCKEFYLLERDGERGQFRRRATILLGNSESPDSTTWDNCYSNNPVMDGVCIHNPPLGFQEMPVFEEPWIVSELEALKVRRKANRKNRPRGTSKTRKSYRARKVARKKAERLEENIGIE